MNKQVFRDELYKENAHKTLDAYLSAGGPPEFVIISRQALAGTPNMKNRLQVETLMTKIKSQRVILDVLYEELEKALKD